MATMFCQKTPCPECNTLGSRSSRGRSGSNSDQNCFAIPYLTSRAGAYFRLSCITWAYPRGLWGLGPTGHCTKGAPKKKKKKGKGKKKRGKKKRKKGKKERKYKST